MKQAIAKVGDTCPANGEPYTEFQLRYMDEHDVNMWFEAEDMTLYFDDGEEG